MGTSVDADTNDPLAGHASNNTHETAQHLPNPVVLGGFATAEPTGCSRDTFATQADPLDRYRAILIEGQTITLFVSDAVAAEFMLELFDSNEPDVPLAVAAGRAAVKSIATPRDGEFDVLITAVSGASNYALTIGQSVIVPMHPDARPDTQQDAEPAPFVPGEIIVRFRESMLPAGAGDSLSMRAAALGMQASAGAAGRAMLFSIAEPGQRQTAFTVNGLDPGDADPAMSDKDRLNRDTVALRNALRQRSDVLSADLNYLREPSYIPDDQLYSLQWHYPLINLPPAWDVTSGDAGVVVAVVDTGVHVDHPDLAAALTTSGYDFISNPQIAVDGNGLDADPDDPGDSSTPGRSSFHGTHVAGTLAALSDNTSGVAGVAPGTRLMPLRALGRGGGTSYDILQALRYAAGLSNDADIVLPEEERADIINLSLGGPAFSQAEQDAYNELRAAGVIVVAAAGNRASAADIYPAGYDNVISVSAVDLDKRLAPYSSFGATVDVAAPGGNIAADDNGDGLPDGVLSTWVDESTGERVPAYRVYQGTSMAAPHVAGVVALMMARHPGLTPEELDALLAAGKITADLEPGGRDNLYGHGLIDALRAVRAAAGLAGGDELPPVVAAAPNAFNFGANLTTVEVNVRNIGGGSMSIVEVSDDADWLTVTEKSVDADKLGVYTLAVDRSGLADSVYSANVTFASDAQETVVVPLTILVDADGLGLTADAGLQFVSLVERASGATLATVSAANIDGEYAYEFNAVAPGEYFVMAGSDFDNDGALCDPGESCGGYPIVSLLKAVTVEAGRAVTGVDFRTNFEVRIRGAGEKTSLSAHPGFPKLPQTNPDAGVLSDAAVGYYVKKYLQ